MNLSWVGVTVAINSYSPVLSAIRKLDVPIKQRDQLSFNSVLDWTIRTHSQCRFRCTTAHLTFQLFCSFFCPNNPKYL